MNDPMADHITLFREDYGRTKKEILLARESILFVANCNSSCRFGYLVITDERMVYVSFHGPRLGRFRRRQATNRIISTNGQFETLLPPERRLSLEDLETRQVSQMSIRNIVGARRLGDIRSEVRGRMTRAVLLALRVQGDSTFDVDGFPRRLVFFDEKDGMKAQELLESMMNQEDSLSGSIPPSTPGGALTDSIVRGS